ncbi:MAG: KH domain-containing protein [Desulfobulbaceae bacterium]|nr:KH domain-containing protein [Desulfobulbaceae bacterium]
MVKGKDFYGSDVAELIEQACKDMDASQEELDIEVLETGSAGIFGLCKKKAHIRVTPKVRQEAQVEKEPEQKAPAGDVEETTVETAVKAPDAVDKTGKQPSQKEVKSEEVKPAEPETISDEVLESIRVDLSELLVLMGYPSEVSVTLENSSVQCRITGEHEEVLIGSEGRTLDSLQYLLRKMMSRCLPDRMMITLDAGNFRERRAQELKERALELAEQVKEDGKTLAIPALNPSERRVVHMTLQEDKAIRSRSVGEGLFKKVLIYKPGKGRKSGSKKRRGRQGGHSSDK